MTSWGERAIFQFDNHFTSNIGSQWIVDQIQAGNTPTSAKLIEVMAQYFRPEFLGRLTEVVPFSPINENVAKEIFLLHFSRLKSSYLNKRTSILSWRKRHSNTSHKKDSHQSTVRVL